MKKFLTTELKLLSSDVKEALRESYPRLETFRPSQSVLDTREVLEFIF